LKPGIGDDRVARLARDLFLRASAAEPEVTADLQQIAARTGTNVDGIFIRDSKTFSTLDARLKTVESIASRIRLDMRDGGLSAEEAAADIRDDLRYTFVLRSSSYGNDIASITRALVSRGYRPRRIKNFWLLNEGYAGMNTSWQTPDGKWFEIQFHTQRTVETKEMLSHQLYERQRSMNPESLDWIAFDMEIEQIWRDVRANPPSMAGLDEVTRYFP
jgi:hypothetical protein